MADITTATHAAYDDNLSDWLLVHAMLTLTGCEKHLVQRYFEHDDHYQQRQEESRGAEPWTSYLIGRLAGMLFQQEEDVVRDMGLVMPEDLETAGPDGEDYRVLLMQQAEHLLAYRKAVIVVNPARGILICPPQSLTNWTATEAVIKGSMAKGDTVMDDVSRVDTYTRYTPRKWETYIEGEDGPEIHADGVYASNGDVSPEDASGATPFRDAAGREVCPVIQVEVPWSVPLGLVIARMHRDIYEMQSRRDFQLGVALNGKIQLATGGDEKLAQVIENRIRKTSAYLMYDKNFGEHKGLQMPVDGIETANGVIDDKRTALRRTAHDALDEAARQSATEAVIANKGGAAAVLSKLAETIADAEQRVLHLWNQAKDFSQDPTRIDVSVEWPKDYSKVFGPDQDFSQRIFGNRLPSTNEARAQVAADKHREAGYEVDEDALAEEVERQQSTQQQANSFLS